MIEWITNWHWMSFAFALSFYFKTHVPVVRVWGEMKGFNIYRLTFRPKLPFGHLNVLYSSNLCRSMWSHSQQYPNLPCFWTLVLLQKLSYYCEGSSQSKISHVSMDKAGHSWTSVPVKATVVPMCPMASHLSTVATEWCFSPAAVGCRA